MPKSIKDLFEVYRPKAKDEADFVDKHVTIKHKDRNGNGDDVFKGNTKYIKRKEERHGYDVNDDEKVYEEVEELDEADRAAPYRKAANAAKREGDMKNYHRNMERFHDHKERVAFSSSDRNKHANQASKHRAAWKSIDEEVEELDELSRKTLGTYGSKALRAGLNAKDDAVAKKRLKGSNLASAKLYPSQYEKSPLKAKVVAKEEVEDLEELSRDTIGRYSRKAKSIADNEGGKDRTKGRELAGRKKWGGTMSGVKPARVMATEESELDEINNPIVKSAPRGYGSSSKKPASNSGTWTSKNKDRGGNYEQPKIYASAMKKEEVEQDQDFYFTEEEDMVINSLAIAAEELGKELDFETLVALAEEVLGELSVSTLKSYRTKARADAYDADAVDDERRFRKRAAGSNLSGKKIVKKGGSLKTEEVEELDELSRKTLGSYAQKAKTQLSRSEYLAGSKMGQRMHGAKPDAQERKLNQRSSKRYAGLETAINKLTREEVEQLDELSPKTLSSYAKKAVNQSFGKGVAGGAALASTDKDTEAVGHKLVNKAAKRMIGAQKAISKLTKEEVELDEAAFAPTMRKAIAAHERGDHKRAKYHLDNAKTARYAMKSTEISKHKDLLDKYKELRAFHEEVEELDEISKSTLGRYINKAKDHIDTTSWRQGYREAGTGSPSGRFERKLSKRHKGIETAVKKLTKEDIINKAIERYIPEDIELPSMEDRLLDKLDGYNLSESQIHTLLSVFESLNEQNQHRMLENVDTVEGVNSLLDFAISHRGE